MKIRLLFTFLLLTACATYPDPIPAFTSTPIVEPSSTKPLEDTSKMTPNPSTPSSPSLQNLIEKAKEDLAKRLSISAEQIRLVEATEVEWSDSSLDCPQPGMTYLQVITPGYRILLEVDGQEYEYHSNRDAYVVLCENRVPPFIPQL
jgi:hypothetical protein